MRQIWVLIIIIFISIAYAGDYRYEKVGWGTETGGSGIIIAPGRNDGVKRLYTCGKFPYEYTWDGNAWIKDSLTTTASYIFSAAAGFGRNDSIWRIYVGDQLGGQLWEYSYDTLNQVWNRNRIDILSCGWLFSVTLGDIKNDDTIRVVAGGGTDSSAIAYTYKKGTGTWAKDTVGVKKGYVRDIIIGNGHNDDTNRVYSSGFGWRIEYTWRGKWDSTLTRVDGEGVTLAKMHGDSLYRVYSPGIEEYLWQANSWQKAQASTPTALFYDLKSGVGRADGKQRLYATVMANVAIDTIYAKVFIYEYGYDESTGWEGENKLSATIWNPITETKHTIQGVVTGQGRNDDTNRVYGICDNGEVFEWTWDDSINGVEQEDVKVVNDLKVRKVLKVAPNPFCNITNISNIPDNMEINIYDITGRQVEKAKTLKVGKQLNTGIYFVFVKGYKPVKITKIK